MSALLAMVRKARRAQQGGMSDEDAAGRIDFLWDEVMRCEDSDGLVTLWDELSKLSPLTHEEAIDLLEREEIRS